MNSSDNLPDKLEVLPSQPAHMLLHHYEPREAGGFQHLFNSKELLEAGAVERS